MTSGPILSLLQSLSGRDIEKLPQSEAASFKAAAAEAFTTACAPLAEMLLRGSSTDDYLWHVQPAEPYSLNYIAAFKLGCERDSWVFAPVTLLVELFGDYHHEGGFSEQPSLGISVRVHSEPWLTALLATNPDVCSRIGWLPRTRGFQLDIRANGDPDADFANPADLRAALLEAVTATRADAIRDAALMGLTQVGHTEVDVTEFVEVRLTIPLASNPTVSGVDEALLLMGLLFRSSEII